MCLMCEDEIDAAPGSLRTIIWCLLHAAKNGFGGVKTPISGTYETHLHLPPSLVKIWFPRVPHWVCTMVY